MHFHRQFCLDPTRGFWFRSETWILDQFSKNWPNIIAESCFRKSSSTEDYQTNSDHILSQIHASGRGTVQNIARQTLTTDYRGFMLPREQQYRTLPDKFWPQIITDSCFRESSSTEHCQTNSDHRLSRIHASERAPVQNIARQIMTTDCRGFMLPRKSSTEDCREKSSTEHCQINSDQILRIHASEREAVPGGTEDCHINPILTTDCRRFMLLREE